MIRLLLLLLLFSCSDNLVDNQKTKWIKDLTVEIDRSNNELYIQAETYPEILSESDSIDSIVVNLEYVGSGNLDYSRSFLLYDNGENGDIISDNGIYTLIDNSNKVDFPDEQADIVNITFPHILGQSLVMKLDMKGIAISFGSACSSGTPKPSRVLLDLGLKMKFLMS